MKNSPLYPTQGIKRPGLGTAVYQKALLWCGRHVARARIYRPRHFHVDRIGKHKELLALERIFLNLFSRAYAR